MQTPKEIKRLIEQVPAAALPELLSCIIKECVYKKTFGERSVAAIVESLEARIKGKMGSAR